MEDKTKKLEDAFYSFSTNFPSIEEENKMLKQTVARQRDELNKFRNPPLLVAEVKEINKDKAMVRLPNGNMFYVNMSESCKGLKPGDFALAEQKNLTLIKKVPLTQKFNVEKFVIMEKPIIGWEDIGGLDEAIEEIKEVIELPLKKPELFEKIGITPPKAILLYGPPGTGKTLLAKAVAKSTDSTFIEIVGSELVQKFIGEGAKLVKEIFELARNKSPSIIFIDELDAIAATRIEIGTSGEREVQRTFMQLLAEIDGFKPLGDVKVIGCTNRRDVLDPAVLRPGRLDRQIQVSIPDKKAQKEIFKIHTKRMKIEKFDIKKLLPKMEDFSGAEIRAMCTEAGYFAIRSNRKKVKLQDFLDAVDKVKQREDLDESYLKMFG